MPTKAIITIEQIGKNLFQVRFEEKIVLTLNCIMADGTYEEMTVESIVAMIYEALSRHGQSIGKEWQELAKGWADLLQRPDAGRSEGGK